jgi:hypothetical protein
MTRRRTLGLALGAIVGAIAVACGTTACSEVYTNASEKALEYEGGSFDGKNYVACYGPGKHEYPGASNTFAYYPVGQRDFTFSNSHDARADMAALSATTKDNQELLVSGTIKLTLETDCREFTDPTGRKWPGGKLQFFHELIGKKYGAFNSEGDQPQNDGWSDMLQNYVGAATDRSVDNEALNYEQLDLYSDKDAKRSWEADVKAELPRVLKELTQGVDVFKINAVLLQKPTVRGEIADALSAKQAATLRAQAAQVDQQAAKNFPGGFPAYQAYQQQQAVNEAIKAGKVKVQVVQAPSGSGIIVQPGG